MKALIFMIPLSPVGNYQKKKIKLLLFLCRYDIVNYEGFCYGGKFWYEIHAIHSSSDGADLGGKEK